MNRWIVGDLALGASYVGTFVAIGLRGGLDMSAYAIGFVGLMFVPFVKSRWRDAESRMLTRGVGPVQPSVGMAPSRHVLLWIVASALLGVAFAAGWITRSLNVFCGVLFCAMFLALGVLEVAKRLRTRGGVAA
jgi:hypothetical protein